MSAIKAIEDAAAMVELFNVTDKYITTKPYSRGTSYKGNSTKKGNNPKAIKARRKKNKNKKTHRK